MVYRLIDAALIGIFSMISDFTIEILAKRSLKMMLDLKGLIYDYFSIPFKSKCNFIGHKNFFELIISTQCTFLFVYMHLL